MLPPIGSPPPLPSASPPAHRATADPALPPPDRSEARSEAPEGTPRTPPLVGPPPTFDMTMLEHLRATARDPDLLTAAADHDEANPPSATPPGDTEATGNSNATGETSDADATSNTGDPDATDETGDPV